MFTTPQESHSHSLETLTQFSSHIDFLKSIKKVCDIGCGKGLDIRYWAELTDQDETNPQPLNIKCTALDKNQMTSAEVDLPNIRSIGHDFNTNLSPINSSSQDIVWCHDTLQYAYSPLDLLCEMNRILDPNGMLYIGVPSTVNVDYGRFTSYCMNYQMFTFTLPQLMYFLALAGFDIKDAYFKKEIRVDYIEAIVYKNSEPLSRDTNWGDLVHQDLVSESAREIINTNSFLSDYGLLTQWFDGTVYDYRNHGGRR